MIIQETKDMLRTYAKVIGIFFLVIGVLGFVPGVTQHGNLFGLFHVNAPHNIVHLVTGALGFFASRWGTKPSQLFFQIFGVIYMAIALLGFGYGMRNIFGWLANNRADAWFHFIVGLGSLYLGFFHKK